MKKRSVFYPIIIIINSMFIMLAATYAFTIGGFFREEKAAFVLSRKQMVSNYVNRAETTFSSIEGHMLEIQTMLTRVESVNWLRSSDSSERKVEERKYYELFSQKAHSVEGMDIIFLIDTEGKTSVWAYGDDLASSAKMEFRGYLEEKSDEISNYFSYNWQPYKLGEDQYYLKLYKVSGFMVGALCLESRFADEILGQEENVHSRYLKNSDGEIVFSFGPGDANEKSGEKHLLKGAFRIEQPMPVADLLLCVSFKDNVLEYLRSVVVIIAIFTGAVYLIVDYMFIRYLKKKLLNPITELSKGAEQIIGGNYNYVTKENGEGEVLVLQKAFNNAMQSVVQLRIDTYEYELKQKEQELLRLRQQLRPHFYLNALAVVKGMAFQRKMEEIQSYIDALTIHIRYLLNNERTQISLQQEFDHIENYVNMQRICFPGKITAFLDLDERIRDMMIPYLLLHTIAENAFKHGRGKNNNLMFTLSARKVEDEDFSGVLIEYEDAGTGFTEEFLKDFAKNEPKEGEHLGLNNLKQTLSIYYGQKVAEPIRIMNVNPSGARIEIRIPTDSADPDAANIDK
jgi:sensor histidine kinase YesM